MDSAPTLSRGSFPQLALQILGIITALVLLYRLCDFIYLYFLRTTQLNDYLIDPKQAGTSKSQIALDSSAAKSWALVTGASDGIGKALADQLAHTGFNVVLHGRNPTKLDGVLNRLQAAHPNAHFRVLVADASNSHGMKSAILSMNKDLKALPGPLTLLINNVGGTSPTPRVFTPLRELKHEEADGLIALNARFATQLTRALLPDILLRNKKLGAKAAIVNIGSAAQIGIPMQSVYGASKSFLRTFTCSIARELSMEGYTGVSAMYAVIGVVTYAGPWTEPPTLFTPTAVTMARSLLHKVGCGRIEVTPFWAHAVQVCFANSLPEWLLARIAINEVRNDMAKVDLEAKEA